MHHVIAIGQFKLELQSGNTKFRSKSAILCETLKFYGWPWKTIAHFFLHFFTLCAWFHGNRLIQTGVTVKKCQIRVKIGDFWSHATMTFDRWPWITKGHLPYATSSFVHHFIAICEFRLELQSGNGVMTSLTLSSCVDIIFVNCNNSWKFRDDTMTRTWWKRCNRQTEVFLELLGCS